MFLSVDITRSTIIGNMRPLRGEIGEYVPLHPAEAVLTLWRTAAVLVYAVHEALAPHGLTLPQYNALRIVRGGGVEGMTCAEIGARMISVAPDVTRMLDRLTQLGLISRERSSADRRVVTTRLTPAGRRLAEALDQMSDLLKGGLSTDDELRGVVQPVAARAACNTLNKEDVCHTAPLRHWPRRLIAGGAAANPRRPHTGRRTFGASMPPTRPWASPSSTWASPPCAAASRPTTA
jgi:DNA-binding MarR family transcriptional regulator